MLLCIHFLDVHCEIESSIFTLYSEWVAGFLQIQFVNHRPFRMALAIWYMYYA